MTRHVLESAAQQFAEATARPLSSEARTYIRDDTMTWSSPST